MHEAVLCAVTSSQVVGITGSSGRPLYSEVFTALEGYDRMVLHGKDMSGTMISPSRAKKLYDSEVSKIWDKFEQTEGPLFNTTSELLSELLPVYKYWRNKLKQTTND